METPHTLYLALIVFAVLDLFAMFAQLLHVNNDFNASHRR